MDYGTIKNMGGCQLYCLIWCHPMLLVQGPRNCPPPSVFAYRELSKTGTVGTRLPGNKVAMRSSCYLYTKWNKFDQGICSIKLSAKLLSYLSPWQCDVLCFQGTAGLCKREWPYCTCNSRKVTAKTNVLDMQSKLQHIVLRLSIKNWYHRL